MKTFLKILKFVIYGFIIVVFALIVLSIVFPSITHNAKVNEWTLIECREYLNAVSGAKTNNLNFDFSKLSDNDKMNAVSVGRYFDFLIKTNFVWGTVFNREIVIVCQNQFDNKHLPGFWNSFRRTPAHAVGYSDEMLGLISPEEFTNLNLNGFISVSSLATNTGFRFSKP